MTEPLVSICIPTYNGEQYLKQCIDSCLAQQFLNYEIIICDDGSVDNTIPIIENYNDPKIKFYKNPQNLGLVGNWNRCIELASGQWIKFVFQDDYITIDCLQEFVNEIDEKVNLVVSKRNFILSANASAKDINYYTNVVRTLENATSYKGENYSPALISKLAVENISLNFIGEPSLIFFRKSCLAKTGLFNDSLKQLCDIEFALRIASKYGLKYIPKKLCAFRIHVNSTTTANLNNKYFIVHYIEPLLFSYYLLYDKHFSDFRSYLNFFQKIKLKIYFRLKVYKANKINSKEAHAHYLFNSFNNSFKEIALNKNGNLFIKLLAAIR